jgi:hypothetical protein
LAEQRHINKLSCHTRIFDVIVDAEKMNLSPDSKAKILALEAAHAAAVSTNAPSSS